MSQTIVPRTIVGADVDIVSDDLAWIPIAGMIANWVDGIRVRHSYITDVAVGQDRAEERRGLNGRPYRTFEFTLTSLDRPTTVTLQRMLTRATRAGSVWPLYCDGGRVTADSGTGTGSLNKVFIDTTDRRFYVGGLVMVIQPGRSTMATSFEIRSISSVSSGDITVSQNWTMPIRTSTGCRVYPLVEGRVASSLSMTRLSGSVGSARIVIFEKRGPSQLPYSFETGVELDGFPTYIGLPILNIRPQPGDLVDGVETDGFFESTDRDEFFVAGTTRPTINQQATYLLRRADYFRLLRFWDNAGGRLFPFFLPAWYPEFNVTAISPTSITVEAIGELVDWTMLEYVSVLQRDGTLEVQGIDSVATGAGSTHVLTLNGALDDVPTVGEIRACGAARLVRFASDELLEAWRTPGLVETQIAMVELINEGELLL